MVGTAPTACASQSSTSDRHRVRALREVAKGKRVEAGFGREFLGRGRLQSLAALHEGGQFRRDLSRNGPVIRINLSRR